MREPQPAVRALPGAAAAQEEEAASAVGHHGGVHLQRQERRGSESEQQHEGVVERERLRLRAARRVDCSVPEIAAQHQLSAHGARRTRREFGQIAVAAMVQAHHRFAALLFRLEHHLSLLRRLLLTQRQFKYISDSGSSVYLKRIVIVQQVPDRMIVRQRQRERQSRNLETAYHARNQV